MIDDQTLQKILDEISPEHETPQERDSRARVEDVVDSILRDSRALGHRPSH